MTADTQANGRRPLTDVNDPGQELPAALRQFLTALFAEGDTILVRPIETWVEPATGEKTGKKESRVVYRQVRHFPRSSVLDEPAVFRRLLSMAEREKANLFFGVCPRVGGNEQFDLACHIRTVRALWADLDHCTSAEALARCQAAGLPPPSVVVASGHGVHLYWLLAEPFLIDDAGPPLPLVKEFVEQGQGQKRQCHKYLTDPHTGAKVHDVTKGMPPGLLSPKAEHVKAVLGGVAAAIGGDHTIDLARVLRLPCTLNRKDERNGKPPVPCELVALETDRRYALADFEPFLPKVQPRTAAPNAGSAAASRGITPAQLAKVNELIGVCAAASVGTRSKPDFDLCCWSIKIGLPKEELWALVENVGKFATEGRRYFDLTWGNASEEASYTPPPGGRSRRTATNGQARSSPDVAAAPPAKSQPKTFDLGTLTLRPGPPHATPKRLLVPLAVLKGPCQVDSIGLSNSAAGRKEAARLLAPHFGDSPPHADEISRTFANILVAAEQALACAAGPSGPQLRDIVRQEVPPAFRFCFRTARGLWSEVRKVEVARGDFVTWCPSGLMDAAAMAADAPRTAGGLLVRPALMEAIRCELQVLWADLQASIPDPAAANLSKAAAPAAAEQLRGAIVHLWHAASFQERKPLREGGEVVVAASLASRVRERWRKHQDAQGDAGRIGWEEIHTPLRAWWRPGVDSKGEAVPWLAMRCELASQVRGGHLPGVSNQTDLTILGRAFGLIDPDPKVPTRASGGTFLAVLDSKLGLELIEDPVRWQAHQQESQ